MRRRLHLIAWSLFGSIAVFGCTDYRTLVLGPEAQDASAADYRLSGPYVHENLTVYLIHGRESLPGRSFLTLAEAMERKFVVVHETQSVNELAIENISPAHEVFVQSGDIVKGGQQDRVIAVDFIVPPDSGRVAIDAFCVESGRWSGRGGETVAAFDSSANAAAGKELKLNVQRSMSQSGVWQEVARNQEKLRANAGAVVQSKESPTSFQLTLEAPAVKSASAGYIKTLTGVAAGRHDVIGYAFAVNGKVSSADVYANAELFRKLWPRQLEACAVEAVAEMEKGKTYPAVTAAAVMACLTDAEGGRQSERTPAGPRRGSSRGDRDQQEIEFVLQALPNTPTQVQRSPGSASNVNPPQVDRLQQLERQGGRGTTDAQSIANVVQSIRQPSPAPAADGRVRLLSRETDRNIVFESRDAKVNAVLHRRYVAY
jgi:hypothetical protein